MSRLVRGIHEAQMAEFSLVAQASGAGLAVGAGLLATALWRWLDKVKQRRAIARLLGSGPIKIVADLANH